MKELNVNEIGEVAGGGTCVGETIVLKDGTLYCKGTYTTLTGATTGNALLVYRVKLPTINRLG